MTGGPGSPGEPAISVIIPHLNQHDALARCLASVFAQDYPAGQLEVIVVDNGSTTPCDAVIKSFPGVRLLAEPAPGPGLARNRGVADAKGEILAFIDADCRAGRGWLSAAVDALSRPGSQGVAGGDVRIDVVAPPRLTALEAYESVFAYRQQMYIARDGYSGTGNLAMLRPVYDVVGPFAGIGVAEDYDWGRRAGALGHPPLYCAGMIVYHPARTTMAQLRAKWQRHIAHDLAAAGANGLNRFRWVARAFFILASALPHSLLLAMTRRISGTGNRLRGIGALVAIRWFRCTEMLRQSGDAGRNLAEDWNRSG
jgi:glycosyltransferase involved in cell wall biosynthesis